MYIGLKRPRRGTVAALVALCLTGMVAMAAIVLDGGILFDDRRQLQTQTPAPLPPPPICSFTTPRTTSQV